MNELFGIDMTTLTIALVMLLTFCLATVGWIAWRRRVVFNLGVRNLPRRKAQTLLIVAGLMLSTLIITCALGVGDTVDHSITSQVYKNLGHVDEVIVEQSRSDSTTDVLDGSIDAGILASVDETAAGEDAIDGVMPILAEPVSLINEAAGQSEPRVIAMGLDPARIDDFGGIRTSSGEDFDLEAMPAGSVALNETLAELLTAGAGDTLTLFVQNEPQTVTVGGVVEDSFLSGAAVYNDGAFGDIGGLVMPLSELQRLTGNTETLSAIAISNSGGVRDSESATDTVVATLDAALRPSEAATNPLKQDLLQEAVDASQMFAGLFLVVGLFSVAAGILLILLIFTMLAAERRSEMGMARAVGAQRRQLIQQFISEGAAYSLLAGLAGAALGVLAALGIGLGLSWVFGDFVDVEPYVSARSVIASYALGVVITFIAVVGSSWKISRLNVVAAVRDLPDATSRKRSLRGVIAPVVMVLLGVLMTSSGISSESAMPFMSGVSLLILSGALLIKAIGVPSRIAYSAAGLLILAFWLLPQKQFEQIFGEYDGDFEMFFMSGLFLVIGATLLLMQNDSWLLSGMNRLGSLFRTKLSAFRLAVAYPGASRGRTGMTVAMFSLIVFSLVTIATLNLNFSNAFLSDAATAGWDITGTTMSARLPEETEAELEANGIDSGAITDIGSVSVPSLESVPARVAGERGWLEANVGGADASFIESTEWSFPNRADGYETDAAIIEALLHEPNVVVVPSWYAEADAGMNGDDNPLWIDIDLQEETFAPVTLELRGSDGRPHEVTVIGVIDPKVSGLGEIYGSRETIEGIYDTIDATTYYFRAANPDDSEALARDIESALLPYGVQTISIRELLEDSQRENSGFFLILQAFMALGMLVGVAAIGVIASRNVVDRRQQIGVLRALGFQRSHVSLSFLLEAAFVVGLGVISGTLLGLVLARNLLTSGEIATTGGIDFAVPWDTVSIVLALAVGAALLMTWLPARQASRIAPADALRYE